MALNADAIRILNPHLEDPPSRSGPRVASAIGPAETPEIKTSNNHLAESISLISGVVSEINPPREQEGGGGRTRTIPACRSRCTGFSQRSRREDTRSLNRNVSPERAGGGGRGRRGQCAAYISITEIPPLIIEEGSCPFSWSVNASRLSDR